MSAVLEGFGSHRRRDDAIRRVYPSYDAAAGYSVRSVRALRGLDDSSTDGAVVTIVGPDGTEVTRRLPPREYLQMVSATNFRTRAGMSVLYYHAELHNYAVIGTSNRSEHEQGAFVKYGDSGVDVSALGHLYKTQVHQLAAFLDIPVEVRRRSLIAHSPNGSEWRGDVVRHPFFCTTDLLLFAQEQGVDAETVARVLGLSLDEVERAFHRFARNRRTTEYLRMAPLGVAERTRKRPRPVPVRAVQPQ
jgi:NAD+ synthase